MLRTFRTCPVDRHRSDWNMIVAENDMRPTPKEYLVTTRMKYEVPVEAVEQVEGPYISRGTIALMAYVGIVGAACIGLMLSGPKANTCPAGEVAMESMTIDFKKPLNGGFITFGNECRPAPGK